MGSMMLTKPNKSVTWNGFTALGSSDPSSSGGPKQSAIILSSCPIWAHFLTSSISSSESEEEESSELLVLDDLLSLGWVSDKSSNLSFSSVSANSLSMSLSSSSASEMVFLGATLCFLKDGGRLLFNFLAGLEAAAIGDLFSLSSSEEEELVLLDPCGGSGKSKLVVLLEVLEGVFGGTVRSVWIQVEVI